MQFNPTPAQLNACRRLAMEQNQKLFAQANTLSRDAFDLLDHPDFDSERFDEYLQLRRKAESLFREAIEHLSVLNREFPPPYAFSTSEGATIVTAEKETA
jgi:uncharacterized membrane protein